MEEIQPCLPSPSEAWSLSHHPGQCVKDDHSRKQIQS